MTVSIVIPTFRRYEALNRLLVQLVNYIEDIEEIIVVDSTDENERQKLFTASKITVLYSRHKNGLYQRYLGYQYAISNIILFLDNDMEVLDPLFLNKIKCLFIEEKIIGAALNFVDKHIDTSLSMIPKSFLFRSSSRMLQFVKTLSGYPQLPPGKVGFCGLRGKQPELGGLTEWLSGGAFVVKKGYLFKDYNFYLFDLFEKRMGMGEDLLLGLTLSKQGKFVYFPDLLFYHNDQKDSAYSSDYYTYGCRVLFSRLYLSLEFSRLNNKGKFMPYIHYNWYSFWRVIGLFMNYIVKPSKVQKNILLGTLKGWYLALFTLSFHYQNESLWFKEANEELKNSIY